MLDALRLLSPALSDQMCQAPAIGFDFGRANVCLLALEPECAVDEGHFALLCQFALDAGL